jgi:hypothetical protein
MAQDPFVGYHDVLRRLLDIDFLKTRNARVVEE